LEDGQTISTDGEWLPHLVTRATISGSCLLIGNHKAGAIGQQRYNGMCIDLPYEKKNLPNCGRSSSPSLTIRTKKAKL
jgi:hypothetical protein